MKRLLFYTSMICILATVFIPGCDNSGNESPGVIVFQGMKNDVKGRYIYSVNLTGGNITRLARQIPGEELDHWWTDDGRLVYLEGEYRDPANWLCIMDITGTDRQRILDISGIMIDHFTISPDGETLLLACRAAGTLEKPGGNKPEGMGYDTEYYSLDIESGELNQLTDAPEIRIIGASFSPNSKKIAFIGRTNDPSTHYDIYVMNADGKKLKKLTDHAGSLFHYEKAPKWSPNGRKLLYSLYNVHISDSENRMDIFVLDVNYGIETNLTNSTLDSEAEAVWSPDGKKIAFSSTSNSKENSADYGVYIMNADGSNQFIHQERLTQTYWMPDDNRLVGVRNMGGRKYSLDIYDIEAKSVDTLMTFGDGYEFGAIFYPILVNYGDKK